MHAYMHTHTQTHTYITWKAMAGFDSPDAVGPPEELGALAELRSVRREAAQLRKVFEAAWGPESPTWLNSGLP